MRPASDDPSDQLLSDGSEPFAGFLRDLATLAPSRLPVLLQGPTGCGKELAARELHRRSGRPGPLVPVNCAALAEGILESELFGHARGAFSGAVRERRGAVESAEGGTLFLDEVADLSPRVQSMLLRVIQEREVRRVGEDPVRRVDVRFVAATHVDLEAAAAQGRFRRDLLFRLAGAELRVPGLDQRRHEIPYLVPRMLAQVAAEAGLPVPVIRPDLPKALAGRPWPGHFRELRMALERGLWQARGGALEAAHLGLPLGCASPLRWREATRRFQRDLLRAALAESGGRFAEAARRLGLSRPGLYALIRRLDPQIPPPQTAADA